MKLSTHDPTPAGRLMRSLLNITLYDSTETVSKVPPATKLLEN